MFTFKERKFILETAKFGLLYENLTNADMYYVINSHDPATIMEEYFHDVPVGYIQEGWIDSTIKTITKGFEYIIIKSSDAMNKIETLKHQQTHMFIDTKYKLAQIKAQLAKSNEYLKALQRVKNTPDSGFGAAMKSAGHGISAGKAKIAAMHAKSAAAAKATAFKSSLLYKIMHPIAKAISAFSDSFIHMCTSLGISGALAKAMAPFALAVVSIIAVLIIYKLCKLLLSFIYKQIALYKAGRKEEIQENAKNMASVSLKMQLQAANKIKNKEVKNKVINNIRKKMQAVK